MLVRVRVRVYVRVCALYAQQGDGPALVCPSHTVAGRKVDLETFSTLKLVMSMPDLSQAVPRMPSCKEDAMSSQNGLYRFSAMLYSVTECACIQVSARLLCSHRGMHANLHETRAAL